MSKRHLVAALSLLAALLSPGALRAAEQVVLESNNARYPAGRTLDSSAEIALAADDVVVFATEDGRVLRIAGPYSGPAGGTNDGGEPEDESSLRRILAQLFGRQPEEAGALAGVRGPAGTAVDGADTRTDPWLLHAERTGDQCILRERPVRFWREAVAAPASAEVVEVGSGVGGERTAVLRWPAQATVAEWAAAAPADNAVYLVRPEGELRSVAIRLHALPASLEQEGLVTVAWLASQGCIDQARLLLRDVQSSQGPSRGER